jgi:hypothetical protein
MADVFSGSCLCGAVKLEITAPTKWCAHCHCSMCRRAHAAGFVTWVGVDAASFAWTAGDDVRTSYRSSSDATRTFCSVCGSQLTFQSTRWADEVHVPRALLGERLDREPAAHVFFSDRVAWIDVHDELPKKGGPTGTAPLRVNGGTAR